MTRLLLHDSLTSANLAEPVRQGWVETPVDIELASTLTAGMIGPSDFALLPSPEITLLVDSHQILTDLAILDEPSSTIALRTPVRPDEIEKSAVVLYECSSTAELLARALLWPFFGIETTLWTTEPHPEAQVTVVEGPLALQEPDVGQTLDLGRSWFVMTGMPLVTHLLVAPRDSSGEDRTAVNAAVNQCLTIAHDRRRELRLIFDDLYGIERDRLVTYLSGQRFVLDAGGRDALVALLVRGAGGSLYRPLTRLPFADQEFSESG